MKKAARRVLKGERDFDTDNNETARDDQSVLGQREDVIFIDGQPATWDPLIKKWMKGVDNHNPDVGYDLDEVTVTGKMPRNGFGLPLYDKNGRLTLYDDGGMKDNLDYVGKNIMYPVMGAIVAAPSFGLISKAFTPSTYINLVPRVAAKFGATSPTIARVASLFGAGADMTLAGYFAHEGYNDIKNAVLHPENLLSWTDYGKLGLDALATAGPLGEANKTLTALNKGVRIPFLIDARNTNRYFNWANNRALLLQSFLSNHNFDSNTQQAARKFLYRPLNFVAGIGQKSKSYRPIIRNAAGESIRTSMNIFNDLYRSGAERVLGHPIDLGKVEDYTKNIDFSFLPWDRLGFMFSNNNIRGHNMNNAIYNGKLPISIRLGQEWREGEKFLSSLSPSAMRALTRNYLNAYKDIGVHEGNHNLILDPTLKKETSSLNLFGGNRVDLRLNNAYRVSMKDRFTPSDTSAERAAVNAELRAMLGGPEKIKDLPPERFITILPNGNITTIFSELAKYKKGVSPYMKAYHDNVISELKMRLLKNKIEKTATNREVISNFARAYADRMKQALMYSYKQGGKI